MKILAIHADHLKFKPVKVAIKEAEEVSNKEVKINECLVIFTAVESEDEKNPKVILDNLVNEIKSISEQVKAKNIVLYPYAHLSSKLSSPRFALQMLKDAEYKLKKDFKVTRAPFGHYKSFEISCKGHPLSELSREILADSKGIEKIDKPLEIQIKELNKLDKLRNAFTLVLGKAVLSIFPNSKPALNYLDDDKFYYDFEKPHPFTPDDIKRIEKKMHEILQKVVKLKKSKSEFKDNPYKKEILKEIKKIKIYELDGYEDLILGEALEEIPKNSAFKLLLTSGVYWKGSQYNKQLQRIYGIAFENQKDLDNYLKQLEELEKRSHRKIGKEQGLFVFSELVGPGLPLWTPKGTILRDLLSDYVWELRKEKGYQRVTIPHITKKELYETSGHWEKFADDLFKIKTRDGHLFVMKPMNCPHHTQIFASQMRSYKEMPQRYAETTMVYRDEQSGELTGLSRVLCITQDDAHVFCRKNQLKEEFLKVWDIVDTFYSKFGFELKIRLSFHDPKHFEKYLGTKEVWGFAEKSLIEIAKERKAKFVISEGEAAFYGPKIDFLGVDLLGREWQVATIQLDVNMPDRFGLYCINEKDEKEKIVMIHAAIMGSVERFFSVLLEHFAGKFPLWLSPVQVSIITVTDRSLNFAKELENKLKENDIRVELNDRQETLGKKVLEETMKKVNYIITIGDKETENRTLAIRTRDGKVKFNVKIDEFVKSLKEEISSRSINSKL
ncbi:threonine--tRNA ligase [Candidatus Woesearchaeota archaeon]|nr:threonine--tRNA ligase [Candidatus Woesearchaeota archaeon]